MWCPCFDGSGKGLNGAGLNVGATAVKPGPDLLEEMKKMQASMGHGMHDDPNSVLLEPGKSGEIVWTFPKDADVAIEFACNVPGHYQSGMVGSVAIDH